MNKKEIFFTHGWFPEEDGTFSDLFDYYMKHPQQDPTILKRACIEMSYYVNFCTRIFIHFKDLTDDTYHQFIPEGHEVDIDDYCIYVDFGEYKVYRDTDFASIPYDNLEGLITMALLPLSYNNMFRTLLRGETYLDESLFRK